MPVAALKNQRWPLNQGESLVLQSVESAAPIPDHLLLVTCKLQAARSRQQSQGSNQGSWCRA